MRDVIDNNLFLNISVFTMTLNWNCKWNWSKFPRNPEEIRFSWIFTKVTKPLRVYILRVKARKCGSSWIYRLFYIPLNTSTTLSAESPRESFRSTTRLVQVRNFGGYWWSTWVNTLPPISSLSTVVDGWPDVTWWQKPQQLHFFSLLSLFLSRSITPSFITPTHPLSPPTLIITSRSDFTSPSHSFQSSLSLSRPLSVSFSCSLDQVETTPHHLRYRYTATEDNFTPDLSCN